jgi:sugar lactone lactonase YvrE
MLDATGRFMSYEPGTGKLKVLLKKLEFPNGVAVSRDGAFVLVAESTPKRVLRYWLRGAKAGKSEVFAKVDGYPDNIKRNAQGEFWVALNTGQAKVHGVGAADDQLQAVAVRLAEGGEVLEVLRGRHTNNTVSEVVERNGTLWLGSGVTSFLGELKP